MNVIPIQIPPLRQRREDIPLLVEHFLRHFCERHTRPVKQATPEAMQTLIAAHWPGNVRQLRNMIERLVVTLTGDVIHGSDLPPELSPRKGSTSTVATTLAQSVEECEREAISTALSACDFHREKTAKRLGVSVRTLHYKVGRYGLH